MPKSPARSGGSLLCLSKSQGGRKIDTLLFARSVHAALLIVLRQVCIKAVSETAPHNSVKLLTKEVYTTMTTAHRPTWQAAKGGEEQGGMRIYAASHMTSAKDQISQTKMKFR